MEASIGHLLALFHNWAWSKLELPPFPERGKRDVLEVWDVQDVQIRSVRIRSVVLTISSISTMGKDKGGGVNQGRKWASINFSICQQTDNLSVTKRIFSRRHATLHLAVSIGMSERQYAGNKYHWILSGFCITAPAQPSATVLLCIRPCLCKTR